MNAITRHMDYATRILIVDDDREIRELISAFLGQHGFVAETASGPDEMRARMAVGAYDLIVLDLMMPGEDGLSALRSLGADAPPVIMLSAVGTDIDRIVGLELGADDYLVKPCNPRELLARIRTVLRRQGRGQAAIGDQQARTQARLRFAGWTLDPLARALHDPSGVLVPLGDGEFRLLLALAEHPRRVLTRDQLLDYSRGEQTEVFDRAIDVQMSRLRRKLAAGSGEAELIRTVRGEGYMFTPPVTRG